MTDRSHARNPIHSPVRTIDERILPSARGFGSLLHKLATKTPNGSAKVTFDALGDGVTFLIEPMPNVTEITGPIAAKLHISSSTEDADLFLVLRVFSPDLKEIVFQGALDPHTAIGQGWLRSKVQT